MRIFNGKEVDELLLLDIDATKDGRAPDYEAIEEIVSEAFMPVGYGGGIRTMDEVARLFQCGIEKVVISSAAGDLDLVSEASQRFGAQSVAVCLQVKRGLMGGYSVRFNSGATGSGEKPEDFARKVVAAGAGELIVYAIDRDGAYKGYDLPLLQAVSAAVDVPVVACGGARNIDDFRAAVTEAGCSAVAAGSLFVYRSAGQGVLISYPSQAELTRPVRQSELTMASPAEASAPKGDLKFQVCTRTMMDTTDPDITFDENGVCNYWREYEAFQATLPGAEERERRLRKLIGQTKAWHYRKWDLVNFKAIHKAFGERPMKMLPALGVWQWAYYCWVKGVRMVEILDLIDFNKPRAKQFLIDALGWRDYGGKHHESIFTRFCQGYILPQKFDIDKREAHLSSLILSGQVTREAALAELQQPAYDEMLQQQDKVYVAKKLGSSDAEFDAVLSLPNRKHQSYGTDNEQRKLYLALTRAAQPVTRLAKKFLRKA